MKKRIIIIITIVLIAIIAVGGLLWFNTSKDEPTEVANNNVVESLTPTEAPVVTEAPEPTEAPTAVPTEAPTPEPTATPVTDNTSSEDSTELLLSEHITIINEKTGASTITEELAEKFREYTIFAGMTKEEIENYINNDMRLRTGMALAAMGKEHEHFIYERIEERSATVDTLEDTTAGNGGGGASVPKPTPKPSSSEPVKEENYITPEAPSQTPNPYEQVMELEDGGDGGELIGPEINWN